MDVSSTPAPLLAIELPLPNTTVFVSGTVTPLVISTTPVPAGDLDVNGNNIVSTNNGDINLVPDGSGRIILDTVRVEGNTLSTVNGQALNFNDNVTFAGDVTVTGAFEAATSGTPTLESVGDINIEPAGKLVVDAPIVLKSYTVAQPSARSHSRCNSIRNR